MKKHLFILLLIYNWGAFTQTDSVLSIKTDELKQLFENVSYSSLPFTDTSLRIIRSISEIENVSNFPDRSVYLEKRAEQLKKDWGVDLYGGYAENFNLDPLEDIQQDINYRRRLQLGVQWDVLQGGYLENKLKAQMLQDRIVREQLYNNVDLESRFYLKRFDQTIYTFNTLKLALLQERSSKLTKQHALVSDLVYLKKLKKEELIKIEIRLSEVESLINIYASYNEFLAPEMDALKLDDASLPLIDLNYNAIFQMIGIHTDSINQMEPSADYYKWYHEVGLKPYVRYNYYDVIDPSLGNRAFFAAGVNFTMPLSFDSKLNNEVEYEKRKFENERFIQERSKTHEEVLNNTHAFRFQLKRFVNLYQTRRLIEEKLRIEKAKIKLNSASGSPFEGLDLYDRLMEADIELIDVLQGMYLKALKIHSQIPGSRIEDIILSKSTGDIYGYISGEKRDMYIWSRTFENYTADFLNEYLIHNEVEKVLLAVSEAEQLPEKRNFLESLSNDKEVYYLFGSNKLFYNEDITGYIKNVLKDYGKTGLVGIHLDIEPHTFEDWEENAPGLLEEYTLLVKKVSEFCKAEGLKLEISVPKHYDEMVMKQLFNLVDKVYFMCYENVDTAFLVRKLKPYTTEFKQKVVIALRTEDFQNRLELEKKIKELSNQLEIKEFAYHDLRRMIEFDKRGE